MKIPNYQLFAPALVILLAIIYSDDAAQLKTLASFRKADFRHTQDCLYKRRHTTKNTTFCYSLLNPNHNSTDNLTPSQVSLRYIFYTEAALLWRLYNKWLDCRSRTWNDYVDCLQASDYDGYYLKKFHLDKHILVNRFKYFIWVMNPLKTKVNHCMHFHASNSNPLLPRYMKCSDEYSGLNQDNVGRTFVRLHNQFPKQFWVSEDQSKNAPRSKESLDKEAFYDCLYSPSSSDSDDRKEFCRTFVNPEITARASLDFSSSLVGLNRTGQDYVEFVRSSIVYDCLKYHRTERDDKCEVVFKRVGTWVKGGGHHDPIIEHVWQIINEEEKYENSRLAKYSNFMMSPFILPKRLTKLCELYSLAGEKASQPRPADCEEGGLYYPFL